MRAVRITIGFSLAALSVYAFYLSLPRAPQTAQPVVQDPNVPANSTTDTLLVAKVDDNLYAGPDRSQAIVGRCYLGEEFRFVVQDGDWIQLESADTATALWGHATSFLPPGTPREASYVTIVEGDVRLRDTAEIETETTVHLDAKRRVETTEFKDIRSGDAVNRMFHVVEPGLSGWVSQHSTSGEIEFVDRITGETFAEPISNMDNPK